jgi:hypothetical protein
LVCRTKSIRVCCRERTHYQRRLEGGELKPYVNMIDNSPLGIRDDVPGRKV